jgi:PKD repeat protein
MDARGTTVMVFRDVSGGIESVARPGSAGHFSPSASWTAPQVISVPGESVDQPQVAMDAAGNAVAVWRHTSGPATVQAVSRAADDPWAGWGAPQNLLVNGFSVANPQVSMNAAGDAGVVWEQGAGSAVQGAVRPASAGPSAPFPAARELASGATAEANPSVAVDPAGNAVAAWREDGASSAAVRAAGFDADGPVVTAFTGPASGTVGGSLAFTFAADDVWSPLGAPAAWSFGDGEAGSGGGVSHAYAAPGTYTVSVTRSDVLGNPVVRTRSVTVAAPPAAPAPPPSGPPAPAPAPSPAPPAAPAPAPSAPVSLRSLAARLTGRSWVATFRLGAGAVVRGSLARGARVRTLGPRTLGPGAGRVPLGRLAPGTYRLTLTATAGGRRVTARTRFAVR